MIRVEDHNGVFGVGTLVEGVDQAAYLLICPPHAGQIGLHGFLPVAAFQEPIMRWRSRGPGQLVDNFRQVVPVSGVYGGEIDL